MVGETPRTRRRDRDRAPVFWRLSACPPLETVRLPQSAPGLQWARLLAERTSIGRCPMTDPFTIAGTSFSSRLIVGTARYPNQQVMLDCLEASGAELVTASIRRISLEGYAESLVDLIGGRYRLLPNTAGCVTARDAILIAERVGDGYRQSGSHRADLFPQSGPGGARCRHRNCLGCRPGHGTRLRCGDGRHRHRTIARPTSNGRGDARGRASRAPCAPRRPHPAASFRRAIEPTARSRRLLTRQTPLRGACAGGGSS